MKDKVRGKTEEIKGKVTGDKGLQLKGKARQKVGRVKEATKAIAYDVEHSRKQTKP
ncbi:MAG TPA: CsbD family protein [Candidatus Dormibacteraeota bacterium]